MIVPLEWVFAVPVLVKLGVVFACIVGLNSRGMHLGVSAFIGAAILGLWSALPVRVVAASMAAALVSLDTIFLSALLTGILLLGSLMRTTGQLEEVVSGYRLIVRSPRVATMTLPALIAVLPVPGGAVFSAPMVSAIDEKNELSPRIRAVANYWFRHIIELAWPLYPAFVLSATLAKLPVGTLMAANAYVPLALATIGSLFLLPRTYGRLATARLDAINVPSPIRFLRAFMPLATVVVSAFALEPILSLIPGLHSAARRYLPTIIGVFLAIALSAARSRGVSLRRAFPVKHAVAMAGTVAGIQVFSQITSSVGAAARVGQELSMLGIPSIAVIVLLPFITGLVTGIGFGYVGLAFPIVLAMIPSAASTLSVVATVSLAGAFGFAGMMLSPLHVCMAVSSEHFKVDVIAIIRSIVPPMLTFLLFAACYYLVLSGISRVVTAG